jgi:PKD repeat protein
MATQLLKKLIFFLSFLIFSCGLSAQTITPAKKQETRASLEPCGFDQMHQEKLVSDPAYKKRLEEFEKYVSTYSTERSGTIYKIPCVVHVMSTGNALTDITDDQIRAAIRELNEMFRKIPGTKGDGNGVDLEIEYALAVRDPNGNCTSGINRFNMTGNATYMASGVKRSSNNGISDTDLKNLIRWNTNQYYNIWLISEIDNNEGGSGVQGYATLAGAHGTSSDGTVLLVNAFKIPGGTTLIHELGHSLNLYHTFEGDGSGGTCPTNTSCSTQGDLVCDTPPHKRSSSNCPTGTNSCDGGTSVDLYKRNYLDYSSDVCQNMLTSGQKTRMHAAITGTRKSFLASQGNLSLVPVTSAAINFSVSRSYICGTGQQVKFYDLSGCIPNTYLDNTSWSGISFNWTITNGTTTYTSTLQNPTITFNATGTYDVTLQVTNNYGTSTSAKTGAVVVGASPVTACTPTSQNNGNFWHTVNNVRFNAINNTTDLYVNTAYTNFSCTQNTVVNPESVHELSISISAGSNNPEVFEVYIDYNNNGIFDAVELIHSGSTPKNTTKTDKKNITIPATAVKNTLLRMRVIGEAGTIIAGERNCTSSLLVGDVEDYGIYIQDATPAPPTANFSATPTAAGCASSLLVNFTDLSTGNPTSWQWDINNDGTIDYTTQNPSHTYSIPGAYSVKLIATNANGSNEITKLNYITVGGKTLPYTEDFEGTFAPDGWTVTNGGQATTWEQNASITGRSGTNTKAAFINHYSYSSGIGDEDILTLPPITLSGVSNPELAFYLAYTRFSDQYSERLRVLVSTDCGSTFPNVVYNKSGKNADGNSLSTVNRDGIESPFVPSAAGNWRKETINLNAFNGQTVVIRFVSTNGYGNNLYIDDVNLSGFVQPPPVANFTSNVSTGCAPLTVKFTDTSTESPTSWEWDIDNDGIIDYTTQNPEHTYSNPGTYTVKLTSKNGGGSNTLTKGDFIVVQPGVTPTNEIAITNGTNPSCAGTSLTFTATVSGEGSSPLFQWRKNGLDINGATGTTYTSADLANGDKITFVMTSNANCASPLTVTSNEITLEINSVSEPSVSIAITNGSNPSCEGSSITFQAIVQNGGTNPTYSWKLGAATVGNESAFTLTNPTDGDVVKCEITSNSACATTPNATSGEIVVSVLPVVTPSIAISLSAGSNPACEGSAVTFNSSVTNEGASPSYQWKINNENVGANEASFSTATLQNGDIVTCVLTSNETCATPSQFTSTGITMEINPVVTPAVLISITTGTNPSCNGAALSFTATIENGGANPVYQWKKNGLDIFGETAATYSSSDFSNGDMISCVLTSNAVCASVTNVNSNDINIIREQTADADISIAITSGSNPSCTGSNITFTASPINGGTNPSYQWKLNGNNVGTNQSSYTSASLLNADVVHCIMTSSSQCATSSVATSNAITMSVVNELVPSVSIVITSGSNPSCQGTAITFAASPVNGGTQPTYQWRVNGTNIGGSTETFTVTNLANNSNVNCIMTSSDACANPISATSNTVTLTVNALPVKPVISIVSGNAIKASTSGVHYAWYLNGSLIADTTQTITATISGNYTVIVTDANGCSSASSESFNHNVIGIEKISAENFSVFPNPSNGTFTVNFTSVHKGEIKIHVFNALGELVYAINSEAAKDHKVDLSSFAAGIYMIRVSTNDGATQKKILLQK